MDFVDALDICVYEPRVSLALNGSSSTQCFKRGIMFKICDRIRPDFYPYAVDHGCTTCRSLIPKPSV